MCRFDRNIEYKAEDNAGNDEYRLTRNNALDLYSYLNASLLPGNTSVLPNTLNEYYANCNLQENENTQVCDVNVSLSHFIAVRDLQR
jgi:hypothetical protein